MHDEYKCETCRYNFTILLDELDIYAEECRRENESRGKLEKDEIFVAALAGAALAFEGMRKEIAKHKLVVE